MLASLLNEVDENKFCVDMGVSKVPSEVCQVDTSTVGEASLAKKDRGWAWLVAASVFVALFLCYGTFKSLGVLFNDINEEFTSATWATGFSISMTIGFGVIACK